MSALLYTLGVVVFVLAILVSIGLHELGHMIPAKKFGGKVTQYFIGFGPTVWSRQRGETEYGLKAIPLGGYVKIVGMLPPTVDGVADEVTYDEEGNTVVKVRKSNTGMFTQLISDARAAEWEHVKPGDADRLFYKFAWWKKVVVMAGGPTVNLLIAFFLFWAVFATYGDRSLEPNAGPPVIETVSECLIPYVEEGRACRPDDPPTPAVEAGLLPGDVIVTFNGVEVTGWEQFREMIRANASGEAVIGFERDGQPMTGTTNTTVQARPTSDTDLTLTEVGFLGVTAESHVAITNGGPLYTLEQMGTMTKQHGRGAGPPAGQGVGGGQGHRRRRGTLPRQPREHRRRRPDRRRDRVPRRLRPGREGRLPADAGRRLQPVHRAVQLHPAAAARRRPHRRSVSGRPCRRGLARLSGRPDPGYVDVAKLLPIAYAVAAVLLVMGVVLIVGDLVVPIHLQS